MIYRLIFLNGPRTGERITVAEQPMCFGADPDCTVMVQDAEMARRHAEIFQKGDELFIRDLGSMNKILVNKREVQESRLKHGDEFELGRTRFVVQALVQAEVEGRAAGRRKRRQATWAIAASLLVGLVLALSARYVPRGPDAPIETSGLQPAPTNTSVITRAAATVPPALTEDLRILREDLRAIQDTVKTLGAPAPAAPGTLPTLTPPRSPRSPREEAEELIGAARDARKGGHHAEADRLLAHIQHIDPDFLPAYEERAALFEAQGRKGEAAAQWSEILRRSIESPIYQKAVAERIRLSQAAPPESTAPALRIASVEQNRFPQAEDYDEMRMLKIVLATAEPGQRIDPGAVRVEINFYDRGLATDGIAPTEGRISQQTLDAAPAWGSVTEHVLSATCVIPKGLRARQAESGEARAYHGYHVRVFYRDQLLDETAQPRNLLADLAPDAACALAAEPAP